METDNLQTEQKASSKKNNSTFFKAAIQKKLSIGSANDSYEMEADRVADQVMKMSEPSPHIAHTGALIQKKGTHYEPQMQPLAETITPLIQRSSTENGGMASDHIESQINSSKGGGSSMDSGTQSFMENRFGADFSNVKIHTGSEAVQMSRDLNAQAFAVGNDIYFNEGKYNPASDNGKHLLAHELTHTIQQGGEIGRKVQRYRDSGAFNFGKSDTKTLKEDTFNLKKDKENKPWIEQINVTFDKKKVDANNLKTWSGKGVAKYYDNSAKLSEINFVAVGSSENHGKTSKGNFTVFRMEGIGYNSGKYSAPYKKSEREGPNNRYSKDLNANMSYAVFFNGGQALHVGPLDEGSHGCVHVGWIMQKINYHSVIGLTKVNVSYTIK